MRGQELGVADWSTGGPPIRLHIYQCRHVGARPKTERAWQDLILFEGPLDTVACPRCDDCSDPRI